MAITKWNSRTFHRRLYAGMISTVKLLKRNIDQQQGIVTVYTMFECRRSSIHKTGETLQNDETSDHRCYWLVPRTEMDRLGLTDINALDRIIENVVSPVQERWWQPESTTLIDIKLIENYIHLACVRINPPYFKTPQRT